MHVKKSLASDHGSMLFASCRKSIWLRYGDRVPTCHFWVTQPTPAPYSKAAGGATQPQGREENPKTKPELRACYHHNRPLPLPTPCMHNPTSLHRVPSRMTDGAPPQPPITKTTSPTARENHIAGSASICCLQTPDPKLRPSSTPPTCSCPVSAVLTN